MWDSTNSKGKKLWVPQSALKAGHPLYPFANSMWDSLAILSTPLRMHRMEIATRLTAILPCTNLDASEAFYAKLGFKRNSSYPSYRILSDGNGAHLHLNKVTEDWVAPGGNPFGVYLYTPKIDALAASLGKRLLHKPEHKPWGMYEFALSDPDETLVRIGWPSDSL